MQPGSRAGGWQAARAASLLQLHSPSFGWGRSLQDLGQDSHGLVPRLAPHPRPRRKNDPLSGGAALSLV